MSRRPLGLLLVVYGLLGVALIVSGAMVGLDAAARIERTATIAGGTLEAAARTTRSAADSFVSVDASLAEAQTSADEAANLARDASATLDALSIAMNVSIFGSQPLQPLAGQFATSADQAEQLAATLESVSGSMSATRTDVADIGVELDLLADQLDALQEATGVTAQPPPLRLFVGLLLAWLAIPAVGGLLFGIGLLAAPRKSA